MSMLVPVHVASQTASYYRYYMYVAAHALHVGTRKISLSRNS